MNNTISFHYHDCNKSKINRVILVFSSFYPNLILIPIQYSVDPADGRHHQQPRNVQARSITTYGLFVDDRRRLRLPRKTGIDCLVTVNCSRFCCFLRADRCRSCCCGFVLYLPAALTNLLNFPKKGLPIATKGRNASCWS